MEKALDRIAYLDKIELLLLDVDGVLTDGKVIYDDEGTQIKAFDVKDGLGIRLLMDADISIGIITGRESKALSHRCKNLGITLLYQGIRDKAQTLNDILEKTEISADHTAFMGDDLVDLPVLSKVGFPIAVADATKEVLACAKGITRAKGGNGAVREVCEAILTAKGLWPEIVSRFTK